MSIEHLIRSLEDRGFKFSIWGKSRLLIHRNPNGNVIRREIMDELIEKRVEAVEYLRARAAVQLASPQRREETSITPVPGKPLTAQQLKLINAITYAGSIAQAGRIAGYGTRQATHKAYKAILNRLPGILSKALSTWCIRQDDQ